MSSEATNRLSRAQAQLVRDGICTEDWLAHTFLLVELFSRTGSQQHRAMIAEFHDRVGEGRLPYVEDHDVGALMLEVQADALHDPKVKEFLYMEALFRATWCAQRATAGGEGLSRSLHMRDLERKIAKVRAGAPRRAAPG